MGCKRKVGCLIDTCQPILNNSFLFYQR